MTREEKLAKIYEVISDKKLSLGCLYTAITGNVYRYINDNYAYQDNIGVKTMYFPKRNIIGHPVMIGDVLDWLGTKEKPVGGYYNRANEIIYLRESNGLRKPIDYQTDECIDFVFSLIDND